MLSKLQLNRRFGPKKDRLSESKKKQIQKVQETFLEFASWVDQDLPDGRSKSLMLTNLENAAMWAEKAIECEDTYPKPAPMPFEKVSNE